jgi:hypothetical protein
VNLETRRCPLGRLAIGQVGRCRGENRLLGQADLLDRNAPVVTVQQRLPQWAAGYDPAVSALGLGNI